MRDSISIIRGEQGILRSMKKENPRGKKKQKQKEKNEDLVEVTGNIAGCKRDGGGGK